MADTPDRVLYARLTLNTRLSPYDTREPPLDLRAAFWRTLSLLATSPVEADEGERRIQERLGRYLAERIFTRLPRDSSIEISDIDLRVRVIGYGSALCEIKLPDLGTVREIVDDNYDLFMFLIGADISTGLEREFAIPQGSVRTELSAPAAVESALRGEVPPVAADANGPPNGVGGEGGRGGSVAAGTLTAGEDRLRKIISGTLVLVLILLILGAALVLYTAAQERAINDDERKLVAEERKALFQLAASEVKMASDQNVELGKVVVQGATSEVTALIKGYADMARGSTACCCKTGCPSAPPGRQHGKMPPAGTYQCR